TAVDRDRIRGYGERHGGADRGGTRGPARVRVLDDDRCGLVELEQQRERGREVEQVVVAELGPVELLHRGEANRGRADLTVERGLLMGVFSVAQREGPLGLEP